MLQVRRGKGVVNSYSVQSIELARCTPPRATTAALGTMAEGWHVAEWLWNVWPRVTHALDSITPTSAFAYFIALVWCLAVSRAFAFFKQATRARRV